MAGCPGLLLLKAGLGWKLDYHLHVLVWVPYTAATEWRIQGAVLGKCGLREWGRGEGGEERKVLTGKVALAAGETVPASLGSRELPSPESLGSPPVLGVSVLSRGGWPPEARARHLRGAPRIVHGGLRVQTLSHVTEEVWPSVWSGRTGLRTLYRVPSGSLPSPLQTASYVQRRRPHEVSS